MEILSSTLPAAVIFDMDGVLIDSEPIHFEATRSLLADHGIVFEPDLGQDFVGCTDRDVFRALRVRYELAAGEAELASAWVERVVDLLARPLTPLDGVPTVLEALGGAGVRLALASSSAPAIIAATLDGLGLARAFEFTVSGHDVRSGKPAPDIFLEAARRLRLPPWDCLVVEDSCNGLRAAVAAGMACAVVPCPSTARQDFAGAAVRLERLSDLPAWLGMVAPLVFPCRIAHH
jgi:HAD superfamily hydrolase (TIGR01509 family)